MVVHAFNPNIREAEADDEFKASQDCYTNQPCLEKLKSYGGSHKGRALSQEREGELVRYSPLFYPCRVVKLVFTPPNTHFLLNTPFVFYHFIKITIPLQYKEHSQDHFVALLKRTKKTYLRYFNISHNLAKDNQVVTF